MRTLIDQITEEKEDEILALGQLLAEQLQELLELVETAVNVADENGDVVGRERDHLVRRGRRPEGVKEPLRAGPDGLVRLRREERHQQQVVDHAQAQNG